MTTPTRFPKGVTNVSPRHPLARFKGPDPLKSHVFWTDFDTFVAGDWTITKVGTGTDALTAFDGGALLDTTTAGATDSQILVKTPSGFTLNSGLQSWFRSKHRLSDATTSRLLAGLINASATTFVPTDGFWFDKANAGTTISINSGIAGVVTTTAIAAAVFTAVAATDVVLGIHFDGRSTVSFYINDVCVGSITLASVTAVALAPAFGIQNGAAAAKTLTTDFLLAAEERADLIS